MEGLPQSPSRKSSYGMGLKLTPSENSPFRDPTQFLYFLERSGYEEFIRKRKSGSAYQYGSCLIELSHVEGLGSFIELEELIDGRASEEQIRRIEEGMRALLLRLGIAVEKIEGRGYTLMLAEKQGKEYPRQLPQSWAIIRIRRLPMLPGSERPLIVSDSV